MLENIDERVVDPLLQTKPTLITEAERQMLQSISSCLTPEERRKLKLRAPGEIKESEDGNYSRAAAQYHADKAAKLKDGPEKDAHEAASLAASKAAVACDYAAKASAIATAQSNG
jgi:hypothetical protein